MVPVVHEESLGSVLGNDETINSLKVFTFFFVKAIYILGLLRTVLPRLPAKNSCHPT